MDMTGLGCAFVRLGRAAGKVRSLCFVYLGFQTKQHVLFTVGNIMSVLYCSLSRQTLFLFSCTKNKAQTPTVSTCPL